MKYRNLANSDLEISVVGFGGWGIGGGALWDGYTDTPEAIRTIHAAVDRGITLFDTSPAYADGRSEELFGKALADRRSEVIIADKISPPDVHSSRVRPSVEASLRRLRTDYIDLLQQHWPAEDDEENSRIVEEMLALKREGKVREVGVSNFGGEELELAGHHDRIVSDQLPYNILFRAIEYRIVRALETRSMDIICYSPLLQGLLTGKFADADEVPVVRARTRHFSGERPKARHGEAGAEELTFSTLADLRRIAEEGGLELKELALAWLLRRPRVATILVGARSPAQAEENAKIADLELPDELYDAASEKTEALKEALGPNPDPWQHDSRISFESSE